MTEPNAQNEKPKDERRYDPELLKKGLRCDLDQYEMLKRCSDKKDMTEWNEWRKEHNDEEILLEGAELEGADLGGIPDDGGPFEDAPREGAHLEGANLMGAHMEGTCLCMADLEDADLDDAHLENTNLFEAHLENTSLQDAHLENALLRNAHLEGAILWRTHLEGARLLGIHLEGAILWKAHLEGANLFGVHLQGSDFSRAIVDGRTIVWDCEVNRKTNFQGVGLGSCRIDPATRQLLEYNIRRKNWEEWYKEHHRSLVWLVHKFWEISDYGISTQGVIKTFFKWAFVFAVVHYFWGMIDYHLVGVKDYPGIVSNLFVLEDGQQPVSGWLIPIRAVYFSIVTMTTLGFGDMYANAHGFVRGLFGHLLLALQVILGYVLLGALVTRFAVLFTAGGPAGKFADEKTEG